MSIFDLEINKKYCEDFIRRYKYTTRNGMVTSYFHSEEPLGSVLQVYNGDNDDDSKLYSFNYDVKTNVLTVHGDLEFADVIYTDDILKIRNMKIEKILKRWK